MSTSATQVARLLTLVPYLQKAGQADLAQTAAMFGVTPRQLVADLKVLWFCGLPEGLPDDLIDIDIDGLDAGWIRLSNAEFLSTPMRFTPDEALSLVVALRAVGELADAQMAEAVASAIRKLGQAAGDARAGAPTVAVVGDAGALEVRRALAEAIDARQAVLLAYDGAAGAGPSTAEVEPAALVARDGYAYLQAWNVARNAWRTYRLDRVADVQPTGRPAVGHGEPEPFDGWLDRRAGATPVTIEVAESARWITEYYPIRAARTTPRGVAVDLMVADPVWLRTLLLRLGGQVLRVDPPQAAQSAGQMASETLDAYDSLARQAPPDLSTVGP